MEFGVGETRRADGTVLVRVTGELDIATSPALTDCIESLRGVPGVTIDLTAVGFIDSSALRRILAASRISEAPLTLVCPVENRPVRMVIELYGLDKAIAVLDELPPE